MPEPEPSQSLTLLSWNLFLGAGAPKNLRDHIGRHWKVFFTDWRRPISLEGVAAVIARHDCDVVCLQEVDFGSWRNQRRDQLREIGRATGLGHVVFAQQRGAHFNDGVAVLSRWPFIEARTTNLYHEIERRVLVQTRLDRNGEPWNVLATHLSAFPFNKRLRRKQAEQLAHVVKGLEGRCLLAADFNCNVQSPDLAPLRNGARMRPLVRGASFPCYAPKYCWDNVFASEDVTSLGAEVLREAYSDHLPVVVKAVARS